jgi:Protein of unknown function (DUF3047)
MWTKHTRACVIIAITVVCLSACRHAPQHVAHGNTADRQGGSTSFSSGWQHFKLPGKAPTLYNFVHKDGRDTLTAKAGISASIMRLEVNIDATKLGTIHFSWQVPELIVNADLAERDLDDSPVRIILTFAGDKSKFSTKNAMLSELAQALSSEPLPYATLMYVWCNQRQPGSVVHNPRTDRIRSIVVESGSQNLRHWLDYQRDIRADFEKAFGEAPGHLLSVGMMTDSDNTKSQTSATYGGVSFGKELPGN